jgi:hypothetical protein
MVRKFYQITLYLSVHVIQLLANYEIYYMEDYCRRTGILSVGQEPYKSTIILMAVPVESSYKISQKCSVVVKSPDNFGIIVTINMVIIFFIITYSYRL